MRVRILIASMVLSCGAVFADCPPGYCNLERAVIWTMSPLEGSTLYGTAGHISASVGFGCTDWYYPSGCSGLMWGGWNILSSDFSCTAAVTASAVAFAVIGGTGTVTSAEYSRDSVLLSLHTRSVDCQGTGMVTGIMNLQAAE
jgi:hypothetical protein